MTDEEYHRAMRAAFNKRTQIKQVIYADAPPWRYFQDAPMKTEQASVFPARAWARFPATREVLT